MELGNIFLIMSKYCPNFYSRTSWSSLTKSSLTKLNLIILLYRVRRDANPVGCCGTVPLAGFENPEVYKHFPGVPLLVVSNSIPIDRESGVSGAF